VTLLLLKVGVHTEGFGAIGTIGKLLAPSASLLFITAVVFISISLTLLSSLLSLFLQAHSHDSGGGCEDDEEVMQETSETTPLLPITLRSHSQQQETDTGEEVEEVEDFPHFV